MSAFTLLGGFCSGGRSHGMTVNEIAQDLALYAEDFDGNYYTADIEPYVRQWLRKRGMEL
jgi:hypothetical protein